MSRKGDQLVIVQETEICPYYQMIYEQTRIRPREWDINLMQFLKYKQIT